MYYLALCDAGCPLSRHELTDQEWLLLGVVRREREKLAYKEMADKTSGKQR